MIMRELNRKSLTNFLIKAVKESQYLSTSFDGSNGQSMLKGGDQDRSMSTNDQGTMETVYSP